MTVQKQNEAIARAVEAERKRILEIAGLARAAARFGVTFDVAAAVRARLPVEAISNSVLGEMADRSDETYVSAIALPRAEQSGSAAAIWKKAFSSRTNHGGKTIQRPTLP